jgi:hypothetical protein
MGKQPKWKPPVLICADCDTQREIGNGRMEQADKRGYVCHFGPCPSCGRSTWTKPFKFRPMTREDIKQALEGA